LFKVINFRRLTSKKFVSSAYYDKHQAWVLSATVSC